MPRYVLICVDKSDSLDLRMANREAHLAYVRENQEMVPAAGPLLDGEGRMNGSLFIMEAPDAQAVQAFSLADPYRLAGLFDRVEIRAWRQSVGAPI